MLEIIIICGLAGWRLAYFLVNERGLFNIGGAVRWLAGMRVMQREVQDVVIPVQVPHGELAKMLECVWCTSFWASILMLILWHSPYAVVVWLFATAAVSVLAHQMSERA